VIQCASAVSGVRVTRLILITVTQPLLRRERKWPQVHRALVRSSTIDVE
jgi:hypothetical protein